MTARHLLDSDQDGHWYNRVNLYCWSHNTVHPFTAGEVEQIVYAMTGMLFDARREDADDRYAEYHPKLMLCPKEALMLAQDSECHLEHVEQGIACRKDAA